MTPDDISYAVSLLFCTFCGYPVRRVKDEKQKQMLCSLIGFFMLVILSGFHVLHPLLLTVINAVIVQKTNKKFCHVISFIFCFTYLMFIRMSEYFGVPSPPELSSTALMIMVLKMVGLAYEVNIQHLRSISEEKSDLKSTYTRINPTFINILHYSFCYAGILVGPYYKYRTYEDMFCKAYSANVPHSNFLKKRIAVVPLYMILYVISDYFFPLSLAASEEIWNFHFLTRVLYMWPWFFSFRMRIYIAFVLGECICMNLGLGAYPEVCSNKPGAGPTNFAVLQEIEKNSKSLKDLTYDFESVRCMDEYSSEFRPTIREGIRYWNMTVQYWLAMFIYKKTAAAKPVKMFTTMLVSALWHGVRPGYYLSLLGTPLLLLSELEVEAAWRKKLSASAQKIYDFIWYFVKMQSVSYMGIAFILLDLRAVLHYWNSIYYIGHFFTIFMFVVAFTKNRYTKRTLKKKKNMLELNGSKLS